MNSVECASRFACNVRRLGLRLSGAQVLVALAKGIRRHKGIVTDTGLHGNTVTNVLAVLIDQGLVKYASALKPRLYLLTERGMREAKDLMDMRREEESNG